MYQASELNLQPDVAVGGTDQFSNKEDGMIKVTPYNLDNQNTNLNSAIQASRDHQPCDDEGHQEVVKVYKPIVGYDDDMIKVTTKNLLLFCYLYNHRQCMLFNLVVKRGRLASPLTKKMA